MPRKPLSSLARNFVQGTGFLEQMGRAGNDDEFAFAVYQRIVRGLVELDHSHIESADNEQRWYPHPGQGPGTGEIRPAAARHYCTDILWRSGSDSQCGSSTGARPEKTDRKAIRGRMTAHKAHCVTPRRCASKSMSNRAS